MKNFKKLALSGLFLVIVSFYQQLEAIDLNVVKATAATVAGCTAAMLSSAALVPFFYESLNSDYFYKDIFNIKKPFYKDRQMLRHFSGLCLTSILTIGFGGVATYCSKIGGNTGAMIATFIFSFFGFYTGYLVQEGQFYYLPISEHH